MKGIFCGDCFIIRSLSREDFKIVECDCKNLRGWWIDSIKGIARFDANNRCNAFMIGWHNSYLESVVKGHPISDNDYRYLHELCTNAPNYHFDKSRKNCWSIILRPGQSSDTKWANEEERKKVGL